MKVFFQAATAGFLILTPPALAQDLIRDRNDFFNSVRANPATDEAVWLELLNGLNEWEKVVLVFGFAGRGDWVQCEAIRSFAAERDPGTEFRCNPVN